MRPNRRWAAWVLPTVPLYLGACQLISGLSDLAPGETAGGATASAASGSSSGGVGGEGGGIDGSNGGGGIGGIGGHGGDSTGVGGQGGVALPSCAGEQCTEPLVEALLDPVATLAITHTYLAWGTGDGAATGKIYSVPKVGGSPIITVGPVSVVEVVGDPSPQADQLFWINNGPAAARGIWKSPIVVPQLVYFKQEVNPAKAITAHDTSVYWFVPKDNVLRKAALGGGVPNDFPVATELGDPATIVFGAGTDIYWHGADMASYHINRISYDAKGTFNHVKTTSDTAFGLAFSSNYLYWTEAGVSVPGAVRAASAVDGLPGSNMSIAPSAVNPTHLIAGEKHVYWADEAANCAVDGATIYRRVIPLDASPAEKVSAVTACVTNFVQDAQYVYFGAGTTIYRIQK